MCIVNKKPYNDQPYLVLPNSPFIITRGVNNQSFRGFLYQKGNIYGDAMPLEIAGLTITLRLYKNNILCFRKNILWSDVYLSEFEYQFGVNDLIEPGRYEVELLFTDIDDTTFILPERRNLLEIIVIER